MKRFKMLRGGHFPEILQNERGILLVSVAMIAIVATMFVALAATRKIASMDRARRGHFGDMRLLGLCAGIVAPLRETRGREKGNSSFRIVRRRSHPYNKNCHFRNRERRKVSLGERYS